MIQSIGEKLRLRRLELGITLKTLSSKTGISPSTLLDIENDKYGVLNESILFNLVDVLEVPYEYFFIDDDNQGKKNTVPVDIPFEFAIFSRQKDSLEWLRLICEMRMRGFTIDGLRLIADIAQKHLEEIKSQKKPQP